MKLADPSRMTAAERVDELGDLLAAAVQRFLAAEGKRNRNSRSAQVRLDALAAAEAPCRSTTESPR